jgi:hypothetical protein
LNYNGNNNDAGTSLFLGGAFDTQNLGSQFPNFSRALAGFDGGDWFTTGKQNIVVLNGQPVQQGFIDNPATPNTAGPVIHVTYNWEPFANATQTLARRLVVGGDFIYQEVVNGQIVQISNLIVWQLIGGRYQWNRGQGAQFLGPGTNGPVFAAIAYDPEDFDPDDADPLPAEPDPGINSLFVGGQFTDVSGTPATNIAQFSVPAGWSELVAGGATVETTTGPVRALAVYDAPDAGAGRAGQAGPPILNGVADPGDPPQALYIGGEFNSGIIGWNGVNRFRLSVGSVPQPNVPGSIPVPAGNIDGSVFALATYEVELDGYVDADGTDLDPDPNANDAPQRVLIIGGDFTGRDGVASPGLLGWGAVRPGQDVQDPTYSPALEFLDFGMNIFGTVNALAEWTPASLTQGVQPVPVLAVGGAFAGTITANLGIFNLASPFTLDLARAGGAIGPDGPVFALAAFDDTEEPLEEETLDSGSSNDSLYIGGDFDNITFPFPGAPLPAKNLAYLNAVTGNGPLPDDSFSWGRLGNNGVDFETNVPGRPAVVRALAAFDDGLAGQWDRNDRHVQRSGRLPGLRSGQQFQRHLRKHEPRLLQPRRAAG